MIEEPKPKNSVEGRFQRDTRRAVIWINARVPTFA